MTQIQEKKLSLACEMYRIRVEQARTDFAGILNSLVRKLRADARHQERDEAIETREQAGLIEEAAFVLLTENPDLGFDFDRLLSDVIKGERP